MKNGLICSGNVQIGLLGDNDEFTGYIGVLNTVTLTITPEEGDKKVRKSKMISNYGSTLDSINLPGGNTLELAVDDIDQETLAMAVLGTITDATVPAGTVTNQALTIVALNKWYKLPHRMLSAVVVKTTATVPVVVPAVQYQVDAAAGMIKFLAPAVPGAVTLDYSHAAINAALITPATKTQLNVTINGLMRNLATGKNLVLNIPKASLTPKDPIDWLSGEFAVAALTGDLVSIGSNAPYTIEYET
jgi:hypothetical protein